MVLSDLIKESGLRYDLPEGAEALFSRFFKILREENKKYNLTAITEEREVYIKHFLDSLAALPFLPLGASVIDIGAGAGFPSLPLLIARPDLKITMLDSVGKKVAFLDFALNELGLKASAVHARVEDFAAKKRAAFDCALSRAVAAMPTLLEYSLPLLKVGGTFFAYKTHSDEINAAKRALKELGAGTVKMHDASYFEYNRIIIEVTKESPTPQKYPRPQNKPRLSPL